MLTMSRTHPQSCPIPTGWGGALPLPENNQGQILWWDSLNRGENFRSRFRISHLKSNTICVGFLLAATFNRAGVILPCCQFITSHRIIVVLHNKPTICLLTSASLQCNVERVCRCTWRPDKMLHNLKTQPWAQDCIPPVILPLRLFFFFFLVFGFLCISERSPLSNVGFQYYTGSLHRRYGPW